MVVSTVAGRDDFQILDSIFCFLDLPLSVFLGIPGQLRGSDNDYDHWNKGGRVSDKTAFIRPNLLTLKKRRPNL